MTLAVAVIVALALTISGGAFVVLLRSSLISNIDSAAIARSQDIASLAQGGSLPSVLPPGREVSLVQVIDSAGRVVSASADIRGEGEIAHLRPIGGAVTRTVSDLPIGDGDPYRLTATSAASPSGELIVYVATSLEQVEAGMRTVTTALLIGLPLLFLLVCGLAWWITGRALRPVEAIRSKVEAISGRVSGGRVPEPPRNDEIGRLARTMNDMLDRLESASQAQRRFVSDASHELRSPLATVRAGIEVALAHPDTSDLESVGRVVLEENARLERLVDDLRLLAESDEGALASVRVPVDLDEVVMDEVARLGALEGPAIDVRGVSGARVVGDREQLRRVVRNLLDNARRHAHGEVRIELFSVVGAALFKVFDDGGGIPDEDRDRVFERFARLDKARARDDGGSGLGLAIVKEIVVAHQGEVQVSETPIGTCFEVRLPEWKA